MRKKQISENEVEDGFTEITLEEEQKVPSPSYFKSCCQTQFKMTTFDYTWNIEHFKRYYEVIDTLLSPLFAENGQYKIKMHKCNVNDKEQFIRFYIRTNEEFTGICTITLYDEKFVRSTSSNSISGRITDMTLLIEISGDELYSTHCGDHLTIHCQVEVFRDLVNNSIHMNLLSYSTVKFEDVKSQDSTLEFESKNEESIKFILHKEHYVVSKKLLWATNSSYFKNICLTHKGKEKDMRNELKDDELNTFKHILLFILTGLINQYPWYISFEKLLIAAEKYNVPALKLMCEHYLLRGITIKNAVKLIQYAFLANAKFLEMHSANFIKLRIKEIIVTKEFQDLPQEDINKILELIY